MYRISNVIKRGHKRIKKQTKTKKTKSKVKRQPCSLVLKEISSFYSDTEQNIYIYVTNQKRKVVKKNRLKVIESTRNMT